MNKFFQFLNAGGKRLFHGSSRFDRYYVGVLETGAGFPTADEARKDLRNYDQSFPMWPR
jgi:hypothetical protein